MGVRTKIGPKAEARTTTILGKGIYPIPVASRLSKVSERRIRYWLKRLESEDTKEDNRFWQGEHQPIDKKIVLGFLDLQEVRFVEAFLRAGVSWKLLRAAHEEARRRYATEHPFCTRAFATDGKHIIELLKVSPTCIEYEEIAKAQTVFGSVIQPFIRDLEFSSDQRLLRWWPLGTDRHIVLDPHRQFGQPIDSESGVATEILFLAVKSGQSEREVANWYEVQGSAVRDAINFEQWLADAA